ncbi:hypothetical protein CPB83DRAFT_110870 [Crepidotus variabilis]|uniref:Uncharacterized protein n=1 Tax=Crepidotus variabilis TaxID=179855 RepID=A0A9P6E4Q4_9AGAR|nr:hypothetical protein CPB83DRAFT_110870 [Crepidotus variabilis]
MSQHDVKDAIHGLFESSNLSEERYFALKEMSGNERVIKEIATVLNMQLSSLDSWNWPEKGLLVEIRSDITGRHRIPISSKPFFCTT